MRQPVAVCTVCGKYAFSAAVINNQCAERPPDHRRRRVRCKGVYGSALNVDDWAPCVGCGGSGRDGHSMCAVCQGTGFMFVRGRPRA